MKIDGVNYKFRPQDDLKRWLLRSPEGRTQLMNWKARKPSFHAWKKAPFNQQVLGKAFGIIHYMESHGPERTNTRFKQASIRMKKRFPVRTVSTRYRNQVSIGKFL